MVEPDQPAPRSRRKPEGLGYCGFCLGAPKSFDRSELHRRCPTDSNVRCRCRDELQHRPDAAMREVQGRYCRATPEECAQYDPGLVETTVL